MNFSPVDGLVFWRETDLGSPTSTRGSGQLNQRRILTQIAAVEPADANQAEAEGDEGSDEQHEEHAEAVTRLLAPPFQPLPGLVHPGAS